MGSKKHHASLDCFSIFFSELLAGHIKEIEEISTHLINGAMALSNLSSHASSVPSSRQNSNSM
jgi:hypothetical protein